MKLKEILPYINGVVVIEKTINGSEFTMIRGHWCDGLSDNDIEELMQFGEDNVITIEGFHGCLTHYDDSIYITLEENIGE